MSTRSQFRQYLFNRLQENNSDMSYDMAEHCKLLWSRNMQELPWNIANIPSRFIDGYLKHVLHGLAMDCMKNTLETDVTKY